MGLVHLYPLLFWGSLFDLYVWLIWIKSHGIILENPHLHVQGTLDFCMDNAPINWTL